MANWLKSLVTKEISFCRKGANPDAKIEIYKSVDEPTEDEGKNSALVDLVHKMAEMLKIPIGKAAEPTPIQKSVFTDLWEKNKVSKRFYDVLYTLQDAVWEILYYNNLSNEDKIAQINLVCSEFAAVVASNMPDIETVAKSFEIHKSLELPMREQVYKALEPEDIEKGGTEMTAEELTQVVEGVTKSVMEGVKAELPNVVKSVVEEQLKPVQEEVGKIAGQVEEIGKMAPPSQQTPGQEPVGKKEPGFWDGVI